MTTYLEHANITVPDVDAAIEFLLTLEPAFEVRQDNTPEGSHRWAHVGTDRFYVALQEPNIGAEPSVRRPAYVNYGVNHLGWVVENVEKVSRRLEQRGYKKGTPGEVHRFRKRAYYFDSAGFEWELVEYLSDSTAERNAYH
jgi:catechol 2,3-dioxygenase-like lactoylglutathione lyase family enzyme